MIQKEKIRIVNNSAALYYAVATWVLSGNTPLIHWTDNEGTVHDILFSIPIPVGGDNRQLIIAVLGKKSFAMPLICDPMHETYYAEKMGYPRNSTLIGLTQLFNEIHVLLNQQLSL